MCGRFTNEMTWEQIHELYKLSNVGFPTRSNLQPRFNIAPTQTVMFAHLDKGGNIELNEGRWWLVPFFAKELPKAAMFNARIETVDTSGAFREGFKSRRCLIPADGYFEWTKAEDGGKNPWLLHLPEHQPFSFAGIWAHNDNLDVTSCTIITAPAAPEIEHIHSRMPVILSPEVYSTWLDTDVQGKDAKELLLGAQIDSLLEFHRVARSVNSSRYEGTDTKKPLINSL
jgi:putative SOS response-associated peptidase YedK